MNIQKKIKNLLNLLNSSHLNLKKIKYQMDLISQINDVENYSYLEDLLNPETRTNVRIPTEIPVPSATFQLKSFAIAKTNNKGCWLFKCDPWFLAQRSLIGSSYVRRFKIWDDNYYIDRYYIANSPVGTAGQFLGENMDGQTDVSHMYDWNSWQNIDLGQMIENDVYEQYRLVSASLRVRYIGILDEAQGVIGGSILFNKNSYLSGRYYRDTGMNEIPPDNFDDNEEGQEMYDGAQGEEYMFDYYRHSVYHQENSCLEGIRMLYFPLDNSFNEFKKIVDGEDIDISWPFYTGNYGTTSFASFIIPDSQYRPGFNWYVYAQNLPPEKSCLKVEANFNFECIPTPKFMNYACIDTRPYGLSNKEMEIIRNKMKECAIQKLIK